MALTYSQMIDLGQPAPAFDLPTANPWIDDLPGENRSLADYDEAAVLVVMFLCNHCPYVIHVQQALVQLANDYAERGVACVAISANDAAQYPSDGFSQMQARARDLSYPFPYLYDESQAIAQAYDARCTPDFFVFDRDRRLAYRGRLDATRPGQGTPDGADLRAALDHILETGTPPADQHPSMGCNIKWKPGNAPAYFG